MALRDTIDGPVEDTVDDIRADVSNAQAVDETPGRVWTVIKASLFICFILAVVIFGAANIMKQAFPEWAKRNSRQLSGIEMKTSVEIVKNAAKVPWFSAFKKKNIKDLRYVGTGLHPDYHANPAFKKKFFYQGTVHMMKDYVMDVDMMPAAERARLNEQGGLNFPAIGVDHSEAALYCKSLGEGYRLPTYSELEAAYKLITEQKEQKVRGRFKPNLALTVYETKDQWTSTIQPSEGWFSRFRNDDNYQIFSIKSDGVRYEDDGYDDESVSFRCVKEPSKKI
ncbi:MAG: SUMF1/EgtB/PvdO family nonheme iron enzyme [bacterium]